jgi:hypothetical protein
MRLRGGIVVFGSPARLMLRIFSDRRQDALNVAAAFRAGQFEQASAHGLGGARQQFAKKTQRNIEAKPDFLGQPTVALGAPHQGLEAARREAGARIRGECVEHVLVSPLQQDIRHCSPDLRARRNRKQVCLRFCAGNFDQIAVAEPRRGPQDGFSNTDIVVAGELAHHLDGGVMDRRETAAELGERPFFNSLDQVPENIVEDVDLLIGQPIRLGDKQISNASQRIDAFVFRSALDRLFQLDDKRLPHAHGDGASCTHGGGGVGPPFRR